MKGFSVAALRKLAPAGKKVLFGLLKFGLREVIQSVPVVGSATRLFEEVAQFGLDRLANAGVAIPGLKDAGDFFPADQLAAIERWIGSFGDSFDDLRAKLEACLQAREDAPWEEIAANVEAILEQNEELAQEFAQQQKALEQQTLSLHRIEQQLSEFFQVQKGVPGSLEEIKAALLNHPSAAEWAEFRRGDPEGRRLLHEADELILAGRRAEGEKKYVELLRRRGIGATVIAREFGLRKFAEGDLPAAGAAWNAPGSAVATPAPVTSLLSRQTKRQSQPAGHGWRSLPRGLVVGRKVRVEDEVGRGGMASVYRVIGEDRLNLGKEFALKVPAPGLVVGDEADRFIREIDLSRQLSESARHLAKVNPKKRPPLVEMHDYVIFDDPASGQELYGLVLDFIPGRSLESFLAVRQARERRLEADEIRRIVRPVCSALTFAHTHVPQVLHRDVKSANILISHEGKVLLTDFGIARVLDDSRSRSTKTGNIIGTPVNMPPEMYVPGAVLDERVDVYMVGKLLLELLTFSLQGDPEARPDCPAAWVDLIGDATNHVRGKRPRTIQAFLERFLEQESSPPVVQPPKKDAAEPRQEATPKPTAAPALNQPPADRKTGEIFSLRIAANSEMKFAWIPPGHFLMGGNGQSDNPQHRVNISKGFWMGIYPVTQAQWQAVMVGDNPSHFRGDNRPVENVSWLDCEKFCKNMNKLTGKPIRLPTEAEWEYACRAGTTSEYWSGNGEDALKKVGWYYGNSGSQTHSVGEKNAPNPWGLHDVHGNVSEWCQDWYGTISGDQKDPTGAEKGKARVVRGGPWNNDLVYCLAADRRRHAPGVRHARIGLRVCFRLD